MVLLTEEDALQHGLTIAFGEARNVRRNDERFRGWFGASPLVVSLLWNDLVNEGFIGEGDNVTHFFWTLHYLKAYSSHVVLAGTFGTTEDNIRRVWNKYTDALFSMCLSKLQTAWEDVLAEDNSQIFGTIDGVHCPTEEVGGFDSSMYSHKYNSAGFAYKIVLSIHLQVLMGVNGPFDSSTNDLQMYRNRSKARVPAGRKLCGDLTQS